MQNRCIVQIRGPIDPHNWYNGELGAKTMDMIATRAGCSDQMFPAPLQTI